jgi:hypothetical protein
MVITVLKRLPSNIRIGGECDSFLSPWSVVINSWYYVIWLKVIWSNVLAESQLASPYITPIFLIMEVLLSGKTQYSWPPCPNFGSAQFYIKSFIFHSFTKQATSTRRSTVLSLPFQLVFPALINVNISGSDISTKWNYHNISDKWRLNNWLSAKWRSVFKFLGKGSFLGERAGATLLTVLDESYVR